MDGSAVMPAIPLDAAYTKVVFDGWFSTTAAAHLCPFFNADTVFANYSSTFVFSFDSASPYVCQTHCSERYSGWAVAGYLVRISGSLCHYADTDAPKTLDVRHEWGYRNVSGANSYMTRMHLAKITWRSDNTTPILTPVTAVTLALTDGIASNTNLNPTGKIKYWFMV